MAAAGSTSATWRKRLAIYLGRPCVEYERPGGCMRSAPERAPEHIRPVRLDGRTTMIRAIPLAACAAAFSLGVPARLRTVRQRREGGRRLQLRGGRRGGPRHQGLPFGRRAPHLRHRDAHGRQRLLRPGLCRGDGRRQHDRRQDPAARLGIAGGRSRPRDRDPEPDHPGSDHRRHHHDDAAGRRLQRHRQGRRGERHPGRHDQFVRRHDPEPQRHQPHRPGRVGGGDRRRGAGQMRARPAARPAARSCCRPRPRWATSR